MEHRGRAVLAMDCVPAGAKPHRGRPLNAVVRRHRAERSSSMIARHWRGLVKSDRASDYEAHLRSETLPALEKMRGFLGADVLKRAVEGGIEFLVITRWKSIESIEQFAGADAEAAVVPPKAQAMMIDYDRRARHYEFTEFKGR